jgi:alkylated DNA repair dioxygenase AlkB
METLIKTDKSSLNIGTFDDIDLVLNCVNDIETELEIRPFIKLYGKNVHQNRNVGFFSDISIGYKYSNKMMTSKPLSLNLKTLLDKINTLFSSNYNGILVNEYSNGNDYIGAHSDDEIILNSDIGVVSLSFGAKRKFRIRDKPTKKIVKDISMEHGQLLQMTGKFQTEFTHEIPVEKRVKEKRISFTFRYHVQ